MRPLAPSAQGSLRSKKTSPLNPDARRIRGVFLPGSAQSREGSVATCEVSHVQWRLLNQRLGLLGELDKVGEVTLFVFALSFVCELDYAVEGGGPLLR